MRNIFFLLALTVALFACSKDNDNDNNPTPGNATPSLRFMAGDKFFEWTWGYRQSATKSIGLVRTGTGEYSLWAESDGEYLRLGIPTRLLVEKSYSYINGTTTTAVGTTEVFLTPVDPVNKYAASNRGDAVTVEVTQITSGLATGTFQAQLSVPGTPAKKLQVSGTFANIKVED